ncbi:hypothetical protein J8Z24_21220 (plasmid) [Pseudoalteromonas sp. SCSIO 43201]|uniref:hypothetical protein n=1 Tax=Pseudoalteromonas sp. SCSIO 43201 TaxID=2822842 RepID=UPI0020755A24|nr:hypothetical protein [Pseudoalteromonas sp. SCSIO 43201]USD31138.1 hypothetical protein J8Z24_21220 [Pseudoalteromonas sp. SCSIO 43201]
MMAIMLNPMLVYQSESMNEATQGAFKQSDPNIALTRQLENKPAMLVITDENDTVLLTTVGETHWNMSQERQGNEHDLSGFYFYEQMSEQAQQPVLSQYNTPIKPVLPTLVFTSNAVSAERILAKGVATKSYLVVDNKEYFSKKVTLGWHDALFNEGQFNRALSDLPTLELSIGEISAYTDVRLTELELDPDSHTVHVAGKALHICFRNLLGDWTQTNTELKALLSTIAELGVDQSSIDAQLADTNL